MQLLHYHQVHGGVSRFLKFEYLFTDILGWDNFKQELKEALNRFAEIIRLGILNAAEAPGLRDLLGDLQESGIRLFVVSGGVQAELRDVFQTRELDKYFENIFGSPDSKEDILIRELASGTIELPAVFIGDSRYDYEVAVQSNLDFVFVSNWSEFKGWERFFKDKPVRLVPALIALLHNIEPDRSWA